MDGAAFEAYDRPLGSTGGHAREGLEGRTRNAGGARQPAGATSRSEGSVRGFRKVTMRRSPRNPRPDHAVRSRGRRLIRIAKTAGRSPAGCLAAISLLF